MRRESTTNLSPDANPGDDSNLSLDEKIKQAQARVKAIGAIIDEALGQQYQAIKELERLEFGVFYRFIANELDMEGVGND